MYVLRLSCRYPIPICHNSHPQQISNRSQTIKVCVLQIQMDANEIVKFLTHCELRPSGIKFKVLSFLNGVSRFSNLQVPSSLYPDGGVLPSILWGFYQLPTLTSHQPGSGLKANLTWKPRLSPILSTLDVA